MLTYDLSIPKFVNELSDRLTESQISSGLFLRDAIGRLSFITTDEIVSGPDRRSLSSMITERMENYVDKDGFAVTTAEEMFDDSLVGVQVGRKFKVSTERFDGEVRMLDRRVIGIDWLHSVESISEPTRIVFASLKGGVGRSTALCVCAAHFALEGKRVLAIDMDLEAPGLGTMLLKPEIMPRYGMLDYLVESNLGKIDDNFFVDLVAPSYIGAGFGKVDVIPALGAISSDFPQNVISKIGRAYLDGMTAGGVSNRLRAILDHFDQTGSYDLILIDARSGLHETTGAALISSGAHILLFGTDQPQTLSGFEMLFSNLSSLGPVDWSQRLTIIQAKSGSAEPKQELAFAKDVRELASKWFASPGTASSTPQNVDWTAFEVEWNDDLLATAEADRIIEEIIDETDVKESYAVLAIPESESFRDFNPWRLPDRLTPPIYQGTFNLMLEAVRKTLAYEEYGAPDA